MILPFTERWERRKKLRENCDLSFAALSWALREQWVSDITFSEILNSYNRDVLLYRREIEK